MGLLRQASGPHLGGQCPLYDSFRPWTLDLTEVTEDSYTITVCPIPHLGYCIYERCNFWDEDRQECSGLCFGDYDPLEETASPQPGSGGGG